VGTKLGTFGTTRTTYSAERGGTKPRSIFRSTVTGVPGGNLRLFSISAQLFRRCDFELIGYVFFSTRCHCFGLQVVFLFFRLHRPAECNFAVLRKDFDVASIRGETLIPMDRFSDFLRECAVRRIHLLLICGRACLILGSLSVILRRLISFLIPQDWCGHKRYAKNQQTQRREQSR